MLQVFQKALCHARTCATKSPNETTSVKSCERPCLLAPFSRLHHCITALSRLRARFCGRYWYMVLGYLCECTCWQDFSYVGGESDMISSVVLRMRLSVETTRLRPVQSALRGMEQAGAMLTVFGRIVLHVEASQDLTKIATLSSDEHAF
eukprot:3946709-Amphidinium_carterae.1